MISVQTQAQATLCSLGILSPLVILLIWTLATWKGAVASIILPSPAAVATSFFDMVQRGYSGIGIWTHIGASLARVGIAFFLGASLGIAIGLLRGRVLEIDALFLVPSEILRPDPAARAHTSVHSMVRHRRAIEDPADLPVGLSDHDGQHTGWITVLCHRCLACGTINGCQPLANLSLRGAAIGVAAIMTGLRVAMGTALTILVASELLGGDRGLGFIILDASSFSGRPMSLPASFKSASSGLSATAASHFSPDASSIGKDGVDDRPHSIVPDLCIGARCDPLRYAPRTIVTESYRRAHQFADAGLFTALVPAQDVLNRADALQRRASAGESLPLLGLTFAVKDNIHVAGMITTSNCPALAIMPDETASSVQRLEDAGAVLIGKNTMDQFATGLNGTRTPEPLCRNAIIRPIFQADRVRGLPSLSPATSFHFRLEATLEARGACLRPATGSSG